MVIHLLDCCTSNEGSITFQHSSQREETHSAYRGGKQHRAENAVLNWTLLPCRHLLSVQGLPPSIQTGHSLAWNGTVQVKFYYFIFLDVSTGLPPTFKNIPEKVFNTSAVACCPKQASPVRNQGGWLQWVFIRDCITCLNCCLSLLVGHSEKETSGLGGGSWNSGTIKEIMRWWGQVAVTVSKLNLQ